MALKETLQKLGAEQSTPCVTISFNTHRANLPKIAQDELLLKNLLKEAKDRITKEYEKKSVESLLNKIATIASEIDMRTNLDSMHLFLSNETKEIVKSPWDISKDSVNIATRFALRPLIKAYNRSEPYLILVLSQSEANAYEAVNDGIIQKIKNKDFPFTENVPNTLYPEKLGDPKYVDSINRDFFNRIDKALLKVHNETDLKCVVVCTSANYSMLLQVADKPGIYHGYVSANSKNGNSHQIVQETWKFIQELQSKRRAKDLNAIKNAISKGNVLFDLNEIYKASLKGRGELLVVHQDFKQAVEMTDDNSFVLIDDPSTPGAVDDIVSKIAWEVISKKGRVIFTRQEEMSDLGKIALKTRY